MLGGAKSVAQVAWTSYQAQNKTLTNLSESYFNVETTPKTIAYENAATANRHIKICKVVGLNTSSSPTPTGNITETVLYDGNTTEEITLSDNYKNYDYIDIYGNYGTLAAHTRVFNIPGATETRGLLQVEQPQISDNNLVYMRHLECKFNNSNKVSMHHYTICETPTENRFRDNEKLISIRKIVGVRANVSPENSYSTTETVIGRWINNKPLYRKVIKTTSSDRGVLIECPNVDEMINIRGTQYDAEDNSIYQLDHDEIREAQGYKTCNTIKFLDKNNDWKPNYLYMIHDTNWQPTEIEYTFIIEYTKTTD